MLRRSLFDWQKMFAAFAMIAIMGVPMAPFAYADDTTDASSTSQTTDAATTTPDTSITTGDSTAVATTNNTVNSNTTNTGSSSDATTSDPTTATSTATTTVAEATSSTPDISATTTSDDAASTTVNADNTASLTSTTSADTATGDNTAASTGGSATVSTGNAFSFANVINVINTNIVGSQGLFSFLNTFFANQIDLRNLDLSYFFGGDSTQSTSTDATTTCSLDYCDQAQLTVSTANDATISNAVIARASTGDNTASSTGDAAVSTGDAYAAANVVNVVNTNIIRSHYLLLALNNFGSMAGDITLPGASFFQQLMQAQQVASNQTSIESSSTASVDNTTNAIADSGNNAGTSSSATLSTGSAVANATTYNQVNTNLVGGTTVYFLINVLGNWSGTVQGLPAGMSWTQTPTGIAIFNDPTQSGNDTGMGSLTASTTNSANVQNSVQAYALTGANYVTSDGTSTVTTGDAYASANAVNLVNTNIVGHNWMLAILNIMGNWSGNLAFGHPDLWIGAAAQTPNPTAPGSTIDYQFTVANRGDADATNVQLTANYDHSLLSFAPSDNDTATTSEWDLGTIPAGQTKEFTYSATAGDVSEGSSVPAPLTATVTENEDDNNLADNSDSVTAVIGSLLPDVFSTGGANAGPATGDPKITMKKTVDASTSTLPTTSSYKIVIDNDGGEAYDSVLTDTLTDSSGNTVYTRSWNLDTIDPKDEITLTYDVEYSATSTPGLYTNTAKLTATKGNTAWVHRVDMTPVEATATIELLPPVEGKVLGAEIEPAKCAAYITSYITPDGQNDSQQVRRLQFFLRDFEHNASLQTNGNYDVSTIAAVEAFQNKYSSDVLAPWGETTPTGYVYFTTQKKINEEYCQGVSQFPLTDKQQKEVLAYGSRRTKGHKNPTDQSVYGITTLPAFTEGTGKNRNIVELPLPTISHVTTQNKKDDSITNTFSGASHSFVHDFLADLPFMVNIAHAEGHQ